MSGSNQTLSRPGALPVWPSASPLNPAGLLTYSHPAGAGYELYELPVSRLLGAKAVAPTSGTQQVAKLTYTSAVGAAGTGTITASVTSKDLGRTVTATTATIANSAAVADIATAVALALNTALTADDDLVLTVTSAAGVVLAAGSATADPTLAIVEVSRTVTAGAANNVVTAVVAAVAGTVPDFLGQLAIAGATVKAATSLRNNTWTAVN